MSKKHWYDVIIIAEKSIRIYAEDAEDAREKANAKFQPLWSAENASREDGVLE